GIALDHTAILGDTIEQIAAEKAGILKTGVPVLWCGSDASAEAVIRQRADEVGAPMLTVARETLTVKDMTLDGTTFDFGERKDLHIPLLGSYQPHNAANALCVIDLINKSTDLCVSDSAIRQGLEEVRWPARFEIVHRDPLVIADGGHNPDGIDAAVDSIGHYFGENKVAIVTGVMADKDYRYMASRIAEVACHVFCLTPDNPRALPAADYAEVFASLGVQCTACASVDEAVKRGVTYAEQNGTSLVSLGSLYMYGEVVHALEQL
ncbi:MAG: bifunctional folylpolyglutamate synthase/dihydrofolate synthase, partial [Clostridia bacterium]|nr:bifunctional folylpolyglutamate synthase/dihydrofolate synthase [Clostridia bacterium]